MAIRLESGRILLTELELRRFLLSVVVDPKTRCWFWGGITDRSGYGVFLVRLDSEPQQKHRLAHFVSYNHFIGAVPADKELGHYNFPDGTSDKCAFYEHVRPVTTQQNAQERLGTIERCPFGHLRSIFGVHTVSGECKACSRIRGARYHGRIVCECCGYKPCRFG